MTDLVDADRAFRFQGFGRVLPWPRKGAAAAPMTVRAEFAQLRAYWEALRPPGGLPDRAAIDPRGLLDILDRVFLVERIGPGTTRLRLAGSRLCDLFGIDLRGMPLTGLFAPDARDAAAAAADRVFDDPAILTLSLRAPAGDGALLMLPVAGRSGAPDHALGCLVCPPRGWRRPGRFAVRGVLHERLALPDAAAGAPAPAQHMPGFADRAPPFIAAPAPTRRTHLRVLEGGRRD